MNIMTTLFGDPVPPGVNLVLLTLLLVAVLLLIFWLFRKFVGGPAIKQVRGRQPRLAVTDAANLDDKRRLVLVRRDDVEHLVMIGGATDVLIESNIVRAAPGRITPAQSPLTAEHTLQEEAPNTPVSSVGAAGVGALASIALAKDDNDSLIEEDSINNETVSKDKELNSSSQVELAADSSSVSSQASLSSEAGKQHQNTTPPVLAETEIETDAMVDLEDALGEELSDIDIADTLEASVENSAKPEIATQNVDNGKIIPPDSEKPNLPDNAGIETPDAPEPVKNKVAENTEQTPQEPAAKKQPEPNMEDEMQKLLDELSGEKV